MTSNSHTEKDVAEIAALRAEVQRLQDTLVRIGETDWHTRRVNPNPNGGLRGCAGMIAVYALTGINGSYLTDEAVRNYLISTPDMPKGES